MAGKRLKIEGERRQEVDPEIVPPVRWSPGRARALAALLCGMALPLFTGEVPALSAEDADAIPQI